MKRREALKIIEQMLKQGHTRKEIYDKLLWKIKFRTDLLQFIAMVPTYEDRLRYRKLNLLLFVLLILTAFSKILIASTIILDVSLFLLPFVFLVAFMSIFFAIMVWNFRGNMYRILGLLGIASLLKSLSNFESFSSYSSTEWMIEIAFGYLPAFLIIFLAYFIGTKVFPHYSIWGQLQKKVLGI